jgi:hypothetical protein
MMTREKILDEIREEYPFSDWLDLIIDQCFDDVRDFQRTVEDMLLTNDDVNGIADTAGLNDPGVHELPVSPGWGLEV